MVECVICKFKSHDLASHIKLYHKMKCSKYTEKYNSPFRSDHYLKNCSIRIQGEKNPGYQHGGKFSSLSDKFIHSDKVDKNEIISKISNSNKNNGNQSTTLKYWLNQGLTKDEAEKMLSDRQKTFSLEKCIEKYGEELGKLKWEERQKRWQKTLNDKPIEEIERIHRARLKSTKPYSNVSQKLFKSLVPHLKDKKVYFATHENNLPKSSQEFFYVSKNKDKRFFFDFYYPEKNKIIEFDGDYWHGDERGNKERDAERDSILINEGFQILRITEREYRKDSLATIKKCMDFLNG